MKLIDYDLMYLDYTKYSISEGEIPESFEAFMEWMKTKTVIELLILTYKCRMAQASE